MQNVASLASSLRLLSQRSNRFLLQVMASASSAGDQKPNRLVNERSPYLLQHAHNPVDWYPWGQEAFDAAKQQNKLIFLSVGYSTCHWCHVMERESFENAQIGKLMNQDFINIKVDREERPDVDKMYMTFVQAISGGGGWPMSVFLTPDLKPITGGTYFPPQDSMGRPGFGSVLKIMAQQWREKQDQMLNQGTALTSALHKAALDTAADETHQMPPVATAVTGTFEHLHSAFDERFGGFAKQPKFPQPCNLEFLLWCSHKHKGKQMGADATQMLSVTLNRMAQGGIHDHVAKGFHRYSVDRRWHVPHFEKMLYDQAQLAAIYAQAYQATQNKLYSQVARDILHYVDRDLSHPLGGFYSAEDADSLPDLGSTEKKEGAFCVWTCAELEDILAESISGSSHTLFDVFSHHFSVKPNGDTDPQTDPHGELKDKNVLVAFDSLDTTSRKFDLTEAQTRATLDKSFQLLSEVRKTRPRPHLDDKMLTAWNGLMISGFAKAAAALNDPTYAARAEKAAKFVREHLSSADVLLRSCYNKPDGGVTQISPPIVGFADDYAFLIAGLLDLYECTFNDDWLAWAVELQTKMDDLFWDEDNHGYFLSTNKDKSILIRMKEDQDGAEPSTNSVATMNLCRLSVVLDHSSYMERAKLIFGAFEQRLTKVPFVVPKMVCALMFLSETPTEIVICGRSDDETVKGLTAAAQAAFLPQKVIIHLNGESDDWLKKRVKRLGAFDPLDGKPSAYVCRDFACELPVHTTEDLIPLLSP